MKKFLGIVLFLSLTLPFAGTFAWLSHQQYRVRKEVKKLMLTGIDKKELVHMVFKPLEFESLNWKKKHEFEHKGSMYDIVEKEVIDGEIHLWCWWDYKETKLNNQLNRLAAELFGLRHNSKHNQNTLLSFYRTLFHQIESEPDFTLFFCEELLPFIHTERLITKDFAPPSPPPELS